LDRSNKLDVKRQLVSLGTEVLDRLADLVVAKLKAIRVEAMISKKVATRSNPPIPPLTSEPVTGFTSRFLCTDR
jgi:hypothetical protein